MKRYVPKNHNVSIELLYGLNLLDLLVATVAVLVIFSIMLSNFSHKLYICAILGFVLVILMAKIDDDRGYVVLFNLFLYSISCKHFVKNVLDTGKRKSKKRRSKLIDNLMPISKITDDYVYLKNGYKVSIIKIVPFFFKYLTEERKEYYIEQVYGKAIRLVNIDQKIQIIKLDEAKRFDEDISAEKLKSQSIKYAFARDSLSLNEATIREYIVEERIKAYEKMNENEKIYEPNYYFLIYDKDEKKLAITTDYVMHAFSDNGIKTLTLDMYEKAVFLKSNFHTNFDMSEIKNCKKDDIVKWIYPNSIDVGASEIMIDDVPVYNYIVKKVPLVVAEAWGEELCKIPNTKVVFDVMPMDSYKAIKLIDNSLSELREKSEKNLKPSRLMEIQKQIEALVEVLAYLQSSREKFYIANIYISLYDYEKEKYEKLPSTIKSTKKFISTLKRDFKFKINELGFSANLVFMKQVEFLESVLITGKDYLAKKGIGMYGGLLAASFPFVTQSVSDIGGVNIGNINDKPAIFDFFKRDNAHVNSNMIVIGKSGSGKSYFTKVLLSNLAAENTKIFILDPENEYGEIVTNYSGKIINLVNSKDGLINPFQIIKSIDDSNDMDDRDNFQQDLNMHLQFLESFFAMLLPGLPSDAFEILNNLVKKLYTTGKLAEAKSLDELKPEDYPIFDDLYELLLKQKRNSIDAWTNGRIEILLNYIEKFAGNGRNANLWNGYSKISVDENMIQFNYQQLLMNNNELIANAQMLLVIHWLNNEIMNNRNYNILNNTNRRILVIIDEAHVFIDEKNPIALDFMFNLAKRIRKYSGMQVVITQNIKDFVGTEAIARKSTAIINASQYSFIFSLSPDDLNDLCRLYEKAGGISKEEQSIIIGNERGKAYFLASPNERGVVQISQEKTIEEVFKA